MVDTVDIHYLREAGGARVGASGLQNPGGNRAAEQATYVAADLVIAVTTDDEAELRTFLPRDRVVVVPLIIPSHPRSGGLGRRPILSFVGGGRHLPNVDGILWFVGDVFPLVRDQVPGVKLEIVGADLPEVVNALSAQPSVTVIGPVPATEPYLDRAAVSVAPLRFGAGMKGKVASAMAAGVPVVTTSVGAQGLGPVTDAQIIVADTPAEFASRIVELLSDPARAECVGQSGRRWIEGICGTVAVQIQVSALLHAVSHGEPSASLVLVTRLAGWTRRAIRAAVHAVPLASTVIRRVRSGS